MREGPGAIEAVVGRPAVDPQARPVQSGIGHGRPLKAVPDERLVLGVDQIVHLDVELIDRLRLIVGKLDVVRKRAAGGRRQKAQELFGDRADPFRRNGLTRKWRPAGSGRGFPLRGS